MDSELSLLCDLLTLDRTEIAQRRMPSLPIVEHLDVFEDGALGFLPCGKCVLGNQFGLEGAEETRHRRVVPTVPLAAHAASNATAFETQP